MFRGDCRFRGGEISVLFTPRKLAGIKPSLMGNHYRGLVLVLGLVLLALEYLLFAWIALGLGLVWSLVAISRNRWRLLVDRQRMLQSMGDGNRTNWETDDPVLIWQAVGGSLAEKSWHEAITWLQKLPEGQGRDYWLAVAYLGKQDYARSLSLCPARLDVNWLTLKAQALYRLGEGSKLVAALRSARRFKGVDKETAAEWLFLRGAGYYLNKDKKPARRLLRTVEKKYGSDYGQTSAMLAEIEGW